MSLSPGTKIGPYEIVGSAGAGGMGVVYRARDTRLGRDVAIKALPELFALDPERLARFEREAKLLASLSHANIAAIHGLEEAEGRRYLVLEYVDGPTLAARLAKGPLPVAETLEICRDIAAGLEAAHESGVVHRDLKPGNVMLTASGGVKILDFGLAKGAVASESSPGLQDSPTMTTPPTGAGVILGTAAYMSPEQARGRPVDRRTDIWSFGCVLYECLTGRQLFEGETVSDLIAKILEREPDWAALPRQVPGRVRTLLRRCLTKDARQRLRDIGEARVDLTAAMAGAEEAPAAAPGARPAVAWWVAAALAAVAIGAVAYALGPWGPRRAPQPLVRFTVGAPEGMFLAVPAEAALSPDGRDLAYVAWDSSGIGHIYIRPLASPDPRLVPGTERASLPFWSPDGRMLAFFSNAKLRKVALDGSAPLVLCDAPDARGGAWSPAGVIVFAPDNQGPLVRVSASGGVPAPVTKLDAGRKELGHRYPQFLPDGKHFLYVAIGAGEQPPTYVASLDGGAPVEVCRAGTGARYTAPGYLLFLDTGENSPRRRLLARRFDAAKRRAVGDAQLVLDDVSTDNFGYSNVTTDASGALVVQHFRPPRARLAWRDRRGAALGVAVEDYDGFGSGTLSPDGRRLAYSANSPNDLFVLDLASGVSTRLTFENQWVGNLSVWSPDGRRIAFSRLVAGRGWEIRTKAADGSGPDSLLFRGPGLFSFPASWSSDGRWLLAQCSDTTGNFDLWRIPMDGVGKPEIYQRTPAREQSAVLSPDGRWVAYSTIEGEARAFYVQSFPEPGAKYQIAVPDAEWGLWSDRGDELVVVTTRDEVFTVKVSTVNGFQPGAATRLFRPPADSFLLDIAVGQQRFLTVTPKDASAASRFEVALGWTQLLERK